MRSVSAACVAGLQATAIALLLAACSLGRAAAPPDVLVPFDPAPYQGFVVPEPLLPFQARGAAQISLRGQRESGELWVQALPGPSYALELRARVTGGLALEVRLDPERVLLLDYVNETYVGVANTPDMRRRLFGVDLSVEEFQVLLTGRLPARTYSAWGGQTSATGAVLLRDGAVLLREGAVRHHFQLDAHGLPATWLKERQGVPDFRVEFREYLELPQPSGPALRMPRLVRLYDLRSGAMTGGAAASGAGSGGALLALGLHSVTPGLQGRPRPTDALPPGAAGFAPGTLPHDR